MSDLRPTSTMLPPAAPAPVATAPRWARASLIASAAIIAALLLWGAVLSVHARVGMDRLAVPAVGDDSAQAAVVTAPVEGGRNVLVVTSAPTATSRATQAPETVAIVHASEERPVPVVVSFPTDLRVEVPGHGNRDLATAYATGGPTLLAETLERYSGLPLDHYVEVDLDRITELSEAVGGAPVCLERPLADPSGGVAVVAGRHELAGADLAAFLRAGRGGVEHAERVVRHQVALTGVIARATSREVVLQPVRTWSSVGQLVGSVRTDDQLPVRRTLAWAVGLARGGADDARVVPVPADHAADGATGRPEAAESLFQALRTGAPLPAGDGADGNPAEDDTIRAALAGGSVLPLLNAEPPRIGSPTGRCA